MDGGGQLPDGVDDQVRPGLQIAAGGSLFAPGQFLLGQGGVFFRRQAQQVGTGEDADAERPGVLAFLHIHRGIAHLDHMAEG